MHRACDAERDAPCNAYCDGDVHADVAYIASWLDITPATALESLQCISRMHAAIGEIFPIMILSATVATEAPPIAQRYEGWPEIECDLDATAYLVRYRLGRQEDS